MLLISLDSYLINIPRTPDEFVDFIETQFISHINHMLYRNFINNFKWKRVPMLKYMHISASKKINTSTNMCCLSNTPYTLEITKESGYTRLINGILEDFPYNVSVILNQPAPNSFEIDRDIDELFIIAKNKTKVKVSDKVKRVYYISSNIDLPKNTPTCKYIKISSLINPMKALNVVNQVRYERPAINDVVHDSISTSAEISLDKFPILKTFDIGYLSNFKTITINACEISITSVTTMKCEIMFIYNRLASFPIKICTHDMPNLKKIYCEVDVRVIGRKVETELI